MISGARKDRMWIVGGIVLALVLAAASWFLLISPKLDDAASVRSQTDDAASQNAILAAKVAKLRTDSEGIADLLRSLDALHTQLPTTSGLDEFTRQLTGQAGKAGVTLTGIVIGVPTVVQAKPGSAPAATAPADSDSPDGGAQSGSEAASSTDSAAPSQNASQPVATKPAAQPAAPTANLYAIPVTISADGPLENEQKLLDAIQVQGPRGALVSAVQFSPAPDDAKQAGGEPATGERSPGAGEAVPGTSVPGAGTITRAAGATRQASPGGQGPVIAGGTGTAGVTATGAVTGAVTDAVTGPSAAMATRTTMTVQLTVFVAPQTPDDEAALRKQLGG